MLEYSEPVTKLIDEFKRLPGVGHKSAQRLAFHVLRMTEADVARFVAALEEVKQKIVMCSVCNNLTDVEPCRFCSSQSRDRSMVCVVEEPYNLVAVEKTRSYNGLYHVLHGALSPIRGLGPEDLRLANLLPRLLHHLLQVHAAGKFHLFTSLWLVRKVLRDAANIVAANTRKCKAAALAAHALTHGRAPSL